MPWSRVRRLVFVCHGNICRSPYGELIAGERGWLTGSCGLYTTADRPADESALAGAIIQRRSLSAHRSRTFDGFPWHEGDLIVCFEAAHVEECRRRLGKGALVTLIGLYMRPRRPHVEDPYGLPVEYFATCYELIEEALGRLEAEARAQGGGPVRGLA